MRSEWFLGRAEYVQILKLVRLQLILRMKHSIKRRSISFVYLTFPKGNI